MVAMHVAHISQLAHQIKAPAESHLVGFVFITPKDVRNLVPISFARVGRSVVLRLIDFLPLLPALPLPNVPFPIRLSALAQPVCACSASVSALLSVHIILANVRCVELSHVVRCLCLQDRSGLARLHATAKLRAGHLPEKRGQCSPEDGVRVCDTS